MRPTKEQVLTAVKESTTGSMGAIGLVFTPDVTRNLISKYNCAVEEAISAIREGRQENAYNMQVESGIGLLTDEEIALCPLDSVQGFPMSWIMKK